MNELERLHILKKYILQEYRPHIALLTFNTVSDLRHACKQLEISTPRQEKKVVAFEDKNRSSSSDRSRGFHKKRSSSPFPNKYSDNRSNSPFNNNKERSYSGDRSKSPAESQQRHSSRYDKYVRSDKSNHAERATSKESTDKNARNGSANGPRNRSSTPNRSSSASALNSPRRV